MQVEGYLFLSIERTRIVFIGDKLQLEEAFDWNALLRFNCLDQFLQEFNPVPTREGQLPGWRIDIDSDRLKTWLGSCETRFPVAEKASSDSDTKHG